MLKLDAGSLDWSLQFVSTHGDTNLLPVPFEFEAIKSEWAEVRAHLSAADLTSWNVRPYRRLLAPKNRFGFRSVTQLDPYDFLVYTSLIYEVGHDIEQSRIAKDQEIAMSHRFFPDVDGRFFDPAFDWSRFRERSERLCDDLNTSYVVVTDIADFFPRIYSHPLENALAEALKARPLHGSSLKRFLKQINQNVSYGIPTGPEASFLLAELLLDVIDRGLRSEGAVHCRWSDDFRIFCTSYRDAYTKLNLLAQLLFETYGLTLQQSKTKILTVEQFRENIEREQHAEVTHLTEQFGQLLDDLGIDWGPYQPISIDELTPAEQEQINALNLVGILQDEIECGNGFSQPLVRFVMWRLTQLGNAEALDLLMSRLEYLYPVAADVLKYMYSINISDAEQKQRLVRSLLTLIDGSIVGDSMYLRAWILAILSKPDMPIGE